MASNASTVEVVPSGGPLGVDVLGFDITDFSDDEFNVIHQAWLDHLILRIRGQDILK